MKKIFMLQLLLICFIAKICMGDEFALSVLPQVSIPLEKIIIDEDTSLEYNNGWGISLMGEYSPSILPFVYILGKLDFNLASLAEMDAPLTFFSFAAGVGVHIPVLSWISLKTAGYGGYYAGSFMDNVSNDGMFGALGALDIRISRLMKIEIGITYNNFLWINKSEQVPEDVDPVLLSNKSVYTGISLFAGISLAITPGTHNPQLRIIDIQGDPIFPSLYKFYNDHPIGYVELENKEKKDIGQFVISSFMDTYMDHPQVTVIPGGLKSGEKKRFYLTPYLRETILHNTEVTRIPVKVMIEYDYDGEKIKVEKEKMFRLLNRNAIVWDEVNKAAVFVSPKDPALLTLSKHIIGSASIEKDLAPPVAVFYKAMALFEGLSFMGITYVDDPSSSEIAIGNGTAAVDFIQFPVETLEYGAGDCDDLTVLFSSLLESIGIETAFISTRGHITLAFGLKLPPNEINKIFQTTENLIIHNGETWVPVEVTMIGEGFPAAWQKGASEWRKMNSTKSAYVYPVHKAWEEYEPVRLSSDRRFFSSVQPGHIRMQCEKNIQSFLNNEIEVKINSYINEKGCTREDPYLGTWIGIIYGRFGFMDLAETEFLSILSERDYIPAIVNLGYIYYSKKEYSKAIEFFEKAFSLEPDNAIVLKALHFILEEENINELIKINFTELFNDNSGTADESVPEEIKGNSASVSGKSGIPFWIEE